MPKVLKKILDFSEKIITIVTAGLLIVLTLLVLINIIVRFALPLLFGYVEWSLSLILPALKVITPAVNVFWIQEVTLTLMMWIGFLGAAGCIWTDSHMRLGLVLEKLPGRVQAGVRVFLDILIGVFSFILFLQGVDLVRQTIDATMPTLPLPLGITYCVLPVAGVIMMVFAAMKVLEHVLALFKKKEESST